MWSVVVHPEAVAELAALPAPERVAIVNAFQKLEVLGPTLPFPHSSAIKNADRLRELRPRAGRSPWRAFYRQMGDVIFVVGAIGPEAAVKPRDFVRAVRSAEDRLNKIEQDEEGH
ncbi:type II toxin-antitoxin system RelE/ParE family toxin [Actinoplanes sp. NBRC 101535]|uniref:type II toxin-antitoxin system RelE/ParE family toxin n=1 Tax=Actinoplanes sp. NBRC 101535 TaxID=3032196 RepID=UPI0024A320D6|nr:type II toxin-antitoxin system RelE/ParE family toxin [Actinoplanes sp. NBRC 101535]GLY02167.1 hypothetical protein Acsp01_25460 [Actinoplanes sp. NBRC 101535]